MIVRLLRGAALNLAGWPAWTVVLFCCIEVAGRLADAAPQTSIFVLALATLGDFWLLALWLAARAWSRGAEGY